MHLSILHCLKLLGFWSFQLGQDLRSLVSSFQILLMPQFRALSLEIIDPSFSSGQSEGPCL